MKELMEELNAEVLHLKKQNSEHEEEERMKEGGRGRKKEIK